MLYQHQERGKGRKTYDENGVEQKKLRSTKILHVHRCGYPEFKFFVFLPFLHIHVFIQHVPFQTTVVSFHKQLSSSGLSFQVYNLSCYLS